MSWRLYDMYSEYTVSERAVATVADCVVASIRYALLILTCVTSIDSLISSSSHGGYVDVMHSISTCAIRFCTDKCSITLQKTAAFTQYVLSHSTYFHTVRTFTQYVLSHSTYFHIVRTFTQYVLSHSTYFHTVRTFTQYVLSHSTYFHTVRTFTQYVLSVAFVQKQFVTM